MLLSARCLFYRRSTDFVSHPALPLVCLLSPTVLCVAEELLTEWSRTACSLDKTRCGRLWVNMQSPHFFSPIACSHNTSTPYWKGCKLQKKLHVSDLHNMWTSCPINTTCVCFWWCSWIIPQTLINIQPQQKQRIIQWIIDIAQRSLWDFPAP